MAELRFKREIVEELLLEAGFSNIKSSKISCFGEDFFQTEAFLDKGCSREIYVFIESLGNEIAIHMQNNVDLKILKNSRQVTLSIENGKINKKDGFEIKAFSLRVVFYEANKRLTNFISNLEKITLQ